MAEASSGVEKLVDELSAPVQGSRVEGVVDCSRNALGAYGKVLLGTPAQEPLAPLGSAGEECPAFLVTLCDLPFLPGEALEHIR